MRKTASLGILLVVIITLTMTYVILQAQRAPLWQIKLNNYIQYRNDALYRDPVLSGTVTVEKVTHASQPENFYKTDEMRAVVSDHYWMMENREALSYRPEEVICALLREEISNDGVEVETRYQVVFVVKYSQTAEPGWVVYIGNNTPAIGCNLV